MFKKYYYNYKKDNGLENFFNDKIKVLELSEGIKNIDFGIYNKKKLKKVVFPDSVTRIVESQFGSCDNLLEIRLSNNITYIPRYAINTCKSLKILHLPNNLESIGAYALGNLPSLLEITLPRSLESIGREAFSNTGILVINYEGTMEEWGLIEIDEDAFKNSNINQIVCSDGTITI